MCAVRESEKLHLSVKRAEASIIQNEFQLQIESKNTLTYDSGIGQKNFGN